MYFVTLCPLELYRGRERFLGAFSAVAMSVGVDSLLGSWVKVAGEEAAVRLKRPIVDGGLHEEGQSDRTGDNRQSRQGNTV
jgi:hypothetical protein